MNIKILEDVLYNTYARYAHDGSLKRGKDDGIQETVSAMMEYMRSNNARRFSNINQGRDMLRKNITRESLAGYLAEYFFQISKLSQPETDDDFVLAMKTMSLGHDAAVEQMKKCLLGQQEKIGNLEAKNIAKTVCSRYSRIEMRQLEEQHEVFNQKVEQTIDPKYQVSNVKVNQGLVNYCREEVLSGRQIAIQNELREEGQAAQARREYNLGEDFSAVTAIGNSRNQQQDSVLLLYHPQNPKYKLMVVADGMGGTVDGDKASQEITKQMVGWFEGLDTKIFLDENSQLLEEEWNKKLNEIHQQILEENPASGSTYVGAIVGETSTTIASIGDSRCYIFDSKDHLQQVTVDDNLEFLAFHKKWEDFMKKENRRQLTPKEIRLRRSEKDRLRFRRGSNVITRCLGAKREGPIQARFTKLKNEAYKALLLFSDGVTDCLDDDVLYSVTKRTSPQELAAKIVDKALTTFSLKPELEGKPEYISRIESGKDNTSVVVFDKRNSQEEEER